MIGSPNTTEDGFLAHVSVIKQYLSSDLSFVVGSLTGALDDMSVYCAKYVPSKTACIRSEIKKNL